MKQKQYLNYNYAEPVPAWLADYNHGSPTLLNDFFHSRIVFYPGSGFDGHAVKVFGGSHSAHCFVMVDYILSEAELRGQLQTNGFLGYDVLDICSLTEQDVLGAAPYHWHLSQDELRLAVERSQNFVQGKSYAFLAILQRKHQFGENHGAERLAVLFLHADGIATYDALFANGNAPELFAMLLQEHGFGGNWNCFGSGGLMEKIAVRSKVYPQLILCEDREYMWSGYTKLSLEPTHGGMWNNERYLWKIAKAYLRIPDWACHPGYKCSKIIRAFFKEADQGYVANFDGIRQRCSDYLRFPDTYVEKFDGNWASLKTDAGNQNGHVFDQKDDGEVIIWPPVRERLISLKSNFLA